MSAPSSPILPFVARSRRRIEPYAPWPLVGVVLLLVIVIILTPVLQSIGQPGPGLLSSAELVVDKIAGNTTVHFYVRGLGTTVRYAQIRVGIAIPFSWDGSARLDWSALTWGTWYNSTNVLTLVVETQQNPVALNVSAYYESPSGSTWYAGVVAFYVAASASSTGESLYSATSTSGVAVTSPLAVSNTTLPLPILLANVGPGGPP